MVEIRNKTNQRILINLKGGKNIDLLARGTAVVSDEDIRSSHLQNLLTNRKVIISSKEEKSKKKWKYENTEKTETDVPGTEETKETEVSEPVEKTESEEQPAEQVDSVPEEVHEQPEPKKVPKKKSK